MSRYSKKELIDFLHRYNEQFGKVPTTRDLKSNKDYPHPENYRSVFGSHKNALIEANLFEFREDKTLFDRKQYTKEDIFILTKSFIEKNNRIPTYKDLKNSNNLPSEWVIHKYFNNLNELILLMGYQPTNNNISFQSDEELIKNLYDLFIELKRTPTSRDIQKCSYTASPNAYINRFGSIYESLEFADIPYTKRTRFLSDEEVIEIWIKLKNELKRIPTIEEMRDSKIDVSNSIYERWGNYSSFLKSIGEDSNFNLYGCKTYYTKSQTPCFSYLELLLTQWLEDNSIKFKKDFPYSGILENDNTKRTIDWLITFNEEDYYVELFGIQRSEEYDKKRLKKIDDFKNNGLKLIELYPNEIDKKSLDDTFVFLS